jgi:hypothetical protein
MAEYYYIGDKIKIEYNHTEVEARILKIENMTDISEIDDWYVTLDINGEKLQAKPESIGTKIIDMDELGMGLELLTEDSNRERIK